MPAPLFLAKHYGRLGNRLWTFANAASLAMEGDRSLFHLGFDEYAAYFEGTAGLGIPCFPAAAGRGVWGRATGTVLARRLMFSGKWCGRLSWLIAQEDVPDGVEIRWDHPLVARILAERRPFVLRAWNLHLDACVERHARPVKEYFQLAGEWRRRLDEWWSAQRFSGPVVGVHVRRGDFRTYRGGSFFHDDNAYGRRIREMTGLLGGHANFVVCSDEENGLGSTEGSRVIHGPGHEILDLYALARCHYLIGPPSTYGAWASWLGGVPFWPFVADARLSLGEFSVHRFA